MLTSFDFAAARMMRELTATMPIKAVAKPTEAEVGCAAAIRPEGYCRTVFCRSVQAAANMREILADTAANPFIVDLRHGWSFKENLTYGL
jgi:hypothetical protein